ncbi:MAG: translation elongation factor Ts [Candidatus Omnitrophica bacterium]|nr:translation elongation factor Ts [Candidatus Omnitrophota bacterium]MCM8802803.1 translation elongation factor Ts [Candidatus Omnitrophota bacterium]
MKIEAEKIKKLREKTGLSIMECKKAIEETGGDFEKALEILKKRGIEISEKKVDKEVKEGLIGCYVHTNERIGVLIEVNCESDFVARNSEFKELVKNLCLQIAAMKPKWIDIDSIPEDILKKKKEEIKEQFKDKPESVLDKIVEGKLHDFYKDNVLLKQQFIKDEEITIEEYIKSKIAKLGENIKVKRFVRFEIGE